MNSDAERDLEQERLDLERRRVEVEEARLKKESTPSTGSVLFGAGCAIMAGLFAIAMLFYALQALWCWLPFTC